MKFQTNIGLIDKIARIVIGVLLIALALFGVIGGAGSASFRWRLLSSASARFMRCLALALVRLSRRMSERGSYNIATGVPVAIFLPVRVGQGGSG